MHIIFKTRGEIRRLDMDRLLVLFGTRRTPRKCMGIGVSWGFAVRIRMDSKEQMYHPSYFKTLECGEKVGDGGYGNGGGKGGGKYGKSNGKDLGIGGPAVKCARAPFC